MNHMKLHISVYSTAIAVQIAKPSFKMFKYVKVEKPLSDGQLFRFFIKSCLRISFRCKSVGVCRHFFSSVHSFLLQKQSVSKTASRVSKPCNVSYVSVCHTYRETKSLSWTTVQHKTDIKEKHKTINSCKIKNTEFSYIKTWKLF